MRRADKRSRLQERKMSMLKSIRQDLKILHGMITLMHRSVRQRFPFSSMIPRNFSHVPTNIMANKVPCRLKSFRMSIEGLLSISSLQIQHITQQYHCKTVKNDIYYK